MDEVQRCGDRLILAVKRLVDENNTPGRFILHIGPHTITLADRLRLRHLNRLWNA